MHWGVVGRQRREGGSSRLWAQCRALCGAGAHHLEIRTPTKIRADAQPPAPHRCMFPLFKMKEELLHFPEKDMFIYF